MSVTPTQRTLKALREQGRVVDICERWIPIYKKKKQPGDKDPPDTEPSQPGGFRKDMFGFVDLVAIDRDRGIVAIQSCGSSFKAHYDKIVGSECTPNVKAWLETGNPVELWGWRKIKKARGGKAMIWQPRVQEITLRDLL